MAYLPIEDHGVIGDLQTIALVGRDGTIDWCCLPHFDSPSVFAGILDDEKGGWFRVGARKLVNNKQMYLADSNVLLTRAYAESGIGQIQDLMPVVHGGERKSHQIIRNVTCVRGEVEYELECRPAFDYARAAHRTHRHERGVVFETAGDYVFAFLSPVPVEIDGEGLRATFRLKEGQGACFSFFCVPRDRQKTSDVFDLIGDPVQLVRTTIEYWQRWVSRCSYRGRWNEMVYRSALILKLLTFQPTGAIVAAPTMGLPEHVGGERNWDYRYTWIRDASFTLYGLMRIGYTEEAIGFMRWLEGRCRDIDMSSPSPLHLMYGIHGQNELPESRLDHLKGYRGSRPVRLGNGAYDQLQLDIYGEL
ncbi:MAG: glycoside hydrolase family 15 protein, partial [Candidatus Binatia bacterium]